MSENVVLGFTNPDYENIRVLNRLGGTGDLFVAHPRNIVACPPASYRWRTCRTVPERVTALTLPFGVGHQCGYEFQYILFTMDVRHRVIAHTLGKVDGVEEF